METAVEIKEVSKSYGAHQVLCGLSFSVKRGEIFAILGANGAGKTTTLECIEGIRKYEQGEINVRGKIGVQLQSSSLPKHIKAIEAMQLFAKWNGSEPDADRLERLGVTAFQRKMYKELSTGQKRRLHLAIAMLGNPDIVILDEPTAGLDVEGRTALHTEIRSMKAQGKTILLASHDMSEVEQLCDRIAILKDGTAAFIGTSGDLTSRWQTDHRIYMRLSDPLHTTGLKHCAYQTAEQGYFVFQAENLTNALSELSGEAQKQSVSILDVKVERASLEQSFMDIAQEGKS